MRKRRVFAQNTRSAVATRSLKGDAEFDRRVGIRVTSKRRSLFNYFVYC